MNKRTIVFICRIILTIIFFVLIGFTIYAMSQFNVDDAKATTEELRSISITEALEEEQAISTEVITEEVTEATTELTTEVTTEAMTEEVTEATTEVITEATTAVYTEAQTEAVVEYIPEEVVEEVVEEVQEEVSEPETEAKSGLTYVGCYSLTAYCETGNPCADGAYPQVGYTAACNDPALWHRWVYIEGLGTYYIHDTGGMASNVIDIYVGSYDEAIQFGRWSANVYLVD